MLLLLIILLLVIYWTRNRNFSETFTESTFVGTGDNFEEYKLAKVQYKGTATSIPQIRIFVLAYDAASFERAKSFKYWWAVPLLLPKEARVKNPIFENIIYRNYESILLPHISDLGPSDFIGTISHKAFQKINVPKLDEFLNKFVQHHSPFNFVHFAVHDKKLSNVHPHFLHLWRDCMEPLVGAAHHHHESLYNYWMARREQFEEYCAFFKLAADSQNDYSIVKHEYSMEDSKYGGSVGMSLTPNQLEDLVGLPHYPHHPFVLERLANAYFKSRMPQKSIVLVYAS